MRGVELEGGEVLEAGRVVVATGGWAGQLARTAGAAFPARPTRRHLFVTLPDAKVDPNAPVIWDDRVFAAAGTHSAYQATTTTLTHGGPGDTDTGDRLADAGFTWSAWGENVARGFTDLSDLVAAWMDSPAHRSVILGGHTVGAAAAATSSTGVVYWTLVLAHGA